MYAKGDRMAAWGWGSLSSVRTHKCAMVQLRKNKEKNPSEITLLMRDNFWPFQRGILDNPNTKICILNINLPWDKTSNQVLLQHCCKWTPSSCWAQDLAAGFLHGHTTWSSLSSLGAERTSQPLLCSQHSSTVPSSTNHQLLFPESPSVEIEVL